MARGGSNAIGSAAVILSANADDMVAGFQAGEARTKAFADRVNKNLATINSQPAKVGNNLANATTPPAVKFGGVSEARGVFGEFAKGAKFGEVAALGLIGAVTALGSAIIKTFETRAVEEFNRSLERSAQLTDQLLAVFDKKQKETFKIADLLGPGEAQGVFLMQKLKEAEKFKQDLEATLNRARNAQDKFKNDFADDFKKGLGLGPDIIVREQKLAEAVKEAFAKLEKQNQLVEALKEKLAGSLGWGLPPQNGADFEQWENLGKAQDRQKALADQVDALNKRLQLQADTWGMSALEAEIYALKMEGVADAELEVAAALAKKLDALNAAKFDFAPAAEFGSKQAYSIELSNRFGDMSGRNLLKQAADAGAESQRNLGNAIDATNAKLREQGDTLLKNMDRYKVTVTYHSGEPGFMGKIADAIDSAQQDAARHLDTLRQFNLMPSNSPPTDRTGGKSFMESAGQMVEQLGRVQAQLETLNSQFRTAVGNVESF